MATLRTQAAHFPGIRFWSKPVRVLVAWSQRTRTRAALGQLDDHLLRDIGISRAMAQDEANRAFWKD